MFLCSNTQSGDPHSMKTVLLEASTNKVCVAHHTRKQPKTEQDLFISLTIVSGPGVIDPEHNITHLRVYHEGIYTLYTVPLCTFIQLGYMCT